MLATRHDHGRCLLRGAREHVGHADLHLVGERSGALDRVAQLADVPGPRVALEARHRLGGHGELLVLAGEAALGDVVEEVLHEERDVLGPLPQRRQLDRDHAESVEEILAELPLVHASARRSRLVAATTRTFTGIGADHRRRA
jgi:hypothetical protein